MKSKNLLVSVIMISAPLFFSCGEEITSSESINLSSSSSYSESISSEQASSESSSSASSLSTQSKNGYYKADVSPFTLYKNPKLMGIVAKHPLIASGKVNMLVIPISFEGENYYEPSADDLETINKIYFGKDDGSDFDSLSSYYYKSSYGKLDIQGTIAPVYKEARTAAEYRSTNDMATLATKIFKSEAMKSLDLSDFDLDNDGYIDTVSLVPFTSNPNQSTLIWSALTTYTNNVPSLDSPTPNIFTWIPIGHILNSYNPQDQIVDAHSIIHETGHALGLVDYYSYDYKISPLGGADMMDQAIGDHNAYSKMILGWVNPYVVDGTLSNFSITLNSFAQTGDCLILRDTETDPWNGMPYDEYLLLQYYTPTGANKMDSCESTDLSDSSGTPKTYKEPGLQVFHVDSRLFAQTGKGSYDPNIYITKNYAYTDKLLSEDVFDKDNGTYEKASDIAADNTPIQSRIIPSFDVDSTNRLISIIPATGENTFITTYATSKIGMTKNLFGVGEKYGNDTFTKESFSKTFTNDGKWDDESTLGYSFKVTRNDDSSCDISIYKE